MTRRENHPHGEQLSAYIDSMLDIPKMRGVAEHLRVCAACRSLEADLRRTKKLVRGLPGPPAPPADFWTGAYRQLRTDDRDRAVAARPFWSVLRSPEQLAHRRWAVGIAAAAVAVGIFNAPPMSAPHLIRTPSVRVSSVSNLSPSLLSPQDVSPDVSFLAELHTDSVSCLPLADPDRQKMIAADVRQASVPPAARPEAASDADASF